jgi:hypothetical protein
MLKQHCVLSNGNQLLSDSCCDKSRYTKQCAQHLSCRLLAVGGGLLLIFCGPYIISGNTVLINLDLFLLAATSCAGMKLGTYAIQGFLYIGA